jgi:hypothetical protein
VAAILPTISVAPGDEFGEARDYEPGRPHHGLCSPLNAQQYFWQKINPRGTLTRGQCDGELKGRE